MARKTVDKAAIDAVRAEIGRLQREANALSNRYTASGDGMTSEYFNGRWEGFEMADSLIRALLDGRDVSTVYGGEA
jgi:hypothetical protein